MNTPNYNGQRYSQSFNTINENAENEYTQTAYKNASDNFIKTVSSRIPQQNYLFKESGVPYGIHFTPFHYLEGELPVFSFGNKDLPRCKKPQCSAYLSPFSKWQYNGTNWQCTLCGFDNQTEDHYQNMQDKLSMGAYEFIANASYSERPPMPPAYVFILDVSSNSIRRGIFLSVTETIKHILTNALFPNPDRTKIAFITYDTHVNFFKFDVKLKKNQPQMYCISEEDMFLPAPLDSLLISYDEEKDQLLKFIDYLQSIYSVDKYAENNSHFTQDSNQLLNAIEGGRLLLEKNGGKLITCNSSFSWVYANKMARETITKTTANNLEYIYSTFNPGKYLTEIGRNLTSNLITCDIIHFDSQKNSKIEIIRRDLKVAINIYHVLHLNEICNNCNGDLHFFNDFNIDIDYKKLFNTLRRMVTKFTGWEALCKVRMSSDYTVKEIYTPVLTKNLDLFILPQIDSDQTFTFTIEKIEKLNGQTKLNTDSMNSDSNFFSLQFAVLYTHHEGSKRIRILNYRIPRCFDISNYILNMDFESVSSLFTKISINTLLNKKNMNEALVSYDFSHFKMFNNSINGLRRNNKGLAYLLGYYSYHLGMLKNMIFSPDEIKFCINVEFANFIRVKLLKLNTYEVSCFILPKIYDLQPLLQDENTNLLTNDENNQLILPNLIPNSTQYLQNDALYLIDNGYALTLLPTFGSEENKLNFYDLFFSTSEINEISLIEDNVLYVDYRSNKEKLIKEKIIALLDYIRSTKTIYQNLYFSVEEKLDKKISEAFVEDDLCLWLKQDLSKFTKINAF